MGFAETGISYVTLDRATVRAGAGADPDGFVAGLPVPVAPDEVQREPDLLLAVKAEIDEQRLPGRFLLTGSANVLMLPKVADALPGRMEIVELAPGRCSNSLTWREGARLPHSTACNFA
ncbi:MAG: AAA family ATPase [Pseudonocardiaceae bacterium]